MSAMDYSEVDISLWRERQERLIGLLGWFAAFSVLSAEVFLYLSSGPDVWFILLLPAVIVMLGAMSYRSIRRVRKKVTSRSELLFTLLAIPFTVLVAPLAVPYVVVRYIWNFLRDSKIARRRVAFGALAATATGLLVYFLWKFVLSGATHFSKRGHQPGSGHGLGAAFFLWPVLAVVVLVLVVVLFRGARSAYSHARQSKEFKRWLSRVAGLLVIALVAALAVSDYFTYGANPIFWAAVSLFFVVLTVALLKSAPSIYNRARHSREFRGWLGRMAGLLVMALLAALTGSNYFIYGVNPVFWTSLGLLAFLGAWICYDISRQVRNSRPDRELYELILKERQREQEAREREAREREVRHQQRLGPEPSSRSVPIRRSSSNPEKRKHASPHDASYETRATWAGRRIEREIFLRWGWGRANDVIQDIYTALGPPPMRSAVGLRNEH